MEAAIGSGKVAFNTMQPPSFFSLHSVLGPTEPPSQE